MQFRNNCNGAIASLFLKTSTKSAFNEILQPKLRHATKNTLSIKNLYTHIANKMEQISR